MEILEAFDGYEPPADVRSLVEDLLATVPSQLLAGLHLVRLTNRTALGSRRKRWTWWRGRKLPLAEAAGFYHRRWQGQVACIEVFIDQAFLTAPGWALRVSLMRELLLGRVLYHEVGHHLHATSHPEHREREAVAEAWSKRLLRDHLRMRHRWFWALRPLIVAAVRFFARPHARTPPAYGVEHSRCGKGS